MTLAIETHGLTRSFGPVPGILDLDLAVEEGEVFGFLGPNGSGKTTTIRLLLDLLRPDAGQALLLGQEVRVGGGALRSRVGFLPGDLRLFPWLTGQETLDLLARLSGRPPTRRDDVLARLGLERGALARRVRDYSTGMRQIVGVTAAFQHDPDLLILDEPTTGLDPVVRDAFLELVRETCSRGRTVFLSSHVLAEVERCADRVGLLARSRLHLVESVQRLRETRPRTVTLTYENGRVHTFSSTDPPAVLLEGIDRNGLKDVAIRPSNLDEVFRAVVRDEAAS